MSYIEASDETPEEVWAAIQEQKKKRARKALQRFDALTPEERQRRIEAMEQKIRKERKES